MKRLIILFLLAAFFAPTVSYAQWKWVETGNGFCMTKTGVAFAPCSVAAKAEDSIYVIKNESMLCKNPEGIAALQKYSTALDREAFFKATTEYNCRPKDQNFIARNGVRIEEKKDGAAKVYVYRTRESWWVSADRLESISDACKDELGMMCQILNR